jgi:hypothetical protein
MNQRRPGTVKVDPVAGSMVLVVAGWSLIGYSGADFSFSNQVEQS